MAFRDRYYWNLPDRWGLSTAIRAWPFQILIVSGVALALYFQFGTDDSPEFDMEAPHILESSIRLHDSEGSLICVLSDGVVIRIVELSGDKATVYLPGDPSISGLVDAEELRRKARVATEDEAREPVPWQ
jgi:hypothetical protein